MTSQRNIRLASESDIPEFESLISLSVRTLQRPYYSSDQMEAALGPVFGVDRQLISDKTYFVIEYKRQIVGCGGWSKRKSLFGGDAHRTGPEEELDPAIEPARIRAFFVHPAFARQGIGGRLLAACEEAILEAGFKRIELVATLAGEPLYAAGGYSVTHRFELGLPNGLKLPVVRMRKSVY